MSAGVLAVGSLAGASGVAGWGGGVISLEVWVNSPVAATELGGHLNSGGRGDEGDDGGEFHFI